MFLAIGAKERLSQNADVGHNTQETRMNGLRLLGFAALCCLLQACSSGPRQIPADHPIIGVWEYESDGQTWSREFTINGNCILIGPDGKTWWVSPYRPVNDSFVYVISDKGDKMPHEIISDGRLLVEKGNIATKKQSKAQQSVLECLQGVVSADP